MKACRACKKFKRLTAQPNIGLYADRCTSRRYGTFNVAAANLILKMRPRHPIRISLQLLDAQWRKSGWDVTKKHLPHVDNNRPGIFVTLTHTGRKQLYLIEGFHRATNHRQNRTEWTGYVLTPEESYAILTPHES